MNALWAMTAALAAAGVIALRRAWRLGAGKPRVGWIWAGWSALAASLATAMAAGGWDAGLGAGACLLMLIAYAVVAATAQLRKAKALRERNGDAALDPLARPRRPWRAAARTLTATVLGATSALAICLAVALKAPWEAVDRMVAAAWLLPLLWGAAVTWALADEKLARAAGGLAALTAVGAGAVLLGGAS